MAYKASGPVGPLHVLPIYPAAELFPRMSVYGPFSFYADALASAEPADGSVFVSTLKSGKIVRVR